MTLSSVSVAWQVCRTWASVVRLTTLAAVLAAALFLPACRTATLYNPPRVSFVSSDTTTVERAIMGAMNKQGWAPTREGPGVMLGTLHIRTHMAVVRIAYATDSYQITYVSSDSLNYGHKWFSGAEIIHPNYNAWVQNLIKEINARLAGPGQ